MYKEAGTESKSEQPQAVLIRIKKKVGGQKESKETHAEVEESAGEKNCAKPRLTQLPFQNPPSTPWSAVHDGAGGTTRARFFSEVGDPDKEDFDFFVLTFLGVVGEPGLSSSPLRALVIANMSAPRPVGDMLSPGIGG